LFSRVGSLLDERGGVQCRAHHLGRAGGVEHAGTHDRGGVPLDDLVQPHRRIEGARDLVEVEQRLGQHRELRAGTQSARRRRHGELGQAPAGRQVADGGAAVPQQEPAHADAQPVGVVVLEGPAEAFQRAGRGRGVLVGQGEQQPQQLLLRLGRERGDHAEIDQRQPGIRRQQHVARVRIGVEEAVHQHLAQVGPDQLVGEVLAVELGAPEGAERVDAPALHEVHGQHA
jgi:hypothetical protein